MRLILKLNACLFIYLLHTSIYPGKSGFHSCLSRFQPERERLLSIFAGKNLCLDSLILTLFCKKGGRFDDL